MTSFKREKIQKLEKFKGNFAQEKKFHNKIKNFIKSFYKFDKWLKDYIRVLRHLTSSFRKKSFKPSIDLQIQGNKFVIVLQVVVEMKESKEKYHFIKKNIIFEIVPQQF